ncbi:MAG TPA: peroxidase family protein [Acidimicrobiales bacterium]|nr:peroxidase family protein [Acidimicrobiales bacterium]
MTDTLEARRAPAGDERARRIKVPPSRPSTLSRIVDRPARWLERTFGWEKLPLPLGIVTLVGVRDRLRAECLHDTGVPEEGGTPTEAQHKYRTADGRWNDLEHPRMGAAGTAFGRNVPPEKNLPETGTRLRTPDPGVVSKVLLTRDQFLPATGLNVLAAAWLQFEIHDWFSHKTDPNRRLPLGDTEIDATMEADGTPGKFLSEDTHWWDGSQVYGTSEAERALLRDGPYLRVEEQTLPLDVAGQLDFQSRHAGFWSGWAMLRSLFAMEHNAICDHLRQEEGRTWTDDELFETARLVNVALQAKIHTVEWTPGIIAHPTTQRAMSMNWWGISEELKRSCGRLSESEVLSGIPGSPTDHHGAPYCLTEEFVAVYRMHPLMPDEYVFHSVDGRAERGPMGLTELRADSAVPALREIGVANALYSFGTAHPGQITLHNFPRSLQSFELGDRTLDLAAVDIFRNRERGVPRYNRFRQAFHKPPVRSFDQLTSNAAWAQEIREVYDNDLDAVDLMVGLYAEDLPRGFGFSDTAFRVFVLMASRRLKSDRFFTRHYNADHYTAAGLRWVNGSTMKSVLLRHFGELEPALRPVENAFVPWARVAH